MTEYNYQNRYYYTANTGLNVNGSLVGAGTSLIEELINQVLKDNKGLNHIQSLKFLTKIGAFSNIVSTTVDFAFNGDELSIGEALIDLGSEFALEYAITASLTSAGITAGLGTVLSIAVNSSLIISGANAAWDEVNLEVDSFFEDIINGSLVDLKFIDAYGDHISGIMITTEEFNLLGIRGSILAYLAQATGVTNGGYVTFDDGRDGDAIFDTQYHIEDASKFQTIADNLGISLNDFLNYGIDSKTNADLYEGGFSKIIYEKYNGYDADQSNQFYIQITLNGVEQIVAVDGLKDENGLIIGRDSEIIYGTTDITYPDILTFNQDSNTPIIITKDRSAGFVEGTSIVIGSDEDDTISNSNNSGGVFKDGTIDGGDGIDTIDYSALGFGSRDVTVNLANNTATNGISLNAFTNTLYNIENVIGSAGVDEITGDSNDNILEGGQGDDELDGGIGNDTYIFNGLYDADTISDSDKQGQIVINGNTISGTAYLVDDGNNNLYHLTAGLETYMLVMSGNDLALFNYNDAFNYQAGTLVNEVILENFNSGDLGITLNDATDDDSINYIYNGSSSNDSIIVNDENSLIYTLDGDDSVRIRGGNSNIYSGQGDDLVYVDDGLNDVAGTHNISTGDGNDEIILYDATVTNLDSGSGNDRITVFHSDTTATINSGTGDDRLKSEGNAEFIFQEGDGNDRITDAAGLEKIVFKEGINPEDVHFIYNYDSHLTISYGDSGDTIFVSDFYHTFGSNEEDHTVETMEFADGTIIDMGSYDFTLEMYGTESDDRISLDLELPLEYSYTQTGAGNDRISFGPIGKDSGNNTVYAGTGDDTIINYLGDDTYIFNEGDGKDFIDDHLGDDTIKFGEGIEYDDVYFTRSADYGELNVRFVYSDDQITIHDHYSQGTMENYVLNDGTILVPTIIREELGGSDIFDNYLLSDTSKTYYIDAMDGDDIVTGNADNNILKMGAGNDEVYIYGDNNFVDAGDGNDKILLGDGENEVNSGQGDDIIETGSGNDIIDAGAGDDEIQANEGNNILTGGDGSDVFIITQAPSTATLALEATTLTDTDTITDFDISAQGDKIDLSDFSPKTSFSQLNIYQDGNNAIIDYGNQQIILENIDHTQLNQDHFIGILHQHDIDAGVLDEVIEDYRVDGSNYSDSYAIYGYEGDDVINGIIGRNNILDGGAGDDILIARSATLNGGEGSDIFRFSYFMNEDEGFDNVITDFDVSDPNEKIVLEAADITDFSQLTITDSDQGAVITYKAYSYWGFYDFVNDITLEGVSASQLTADHFQISTLVDASNNDEFLDYSSYSADFHMSGYGGSGTILTGSGSDFVYVEAGSYDLDSGAGNDTIYAWGGDDTIYSGTGDDYIALLYYSSSQSVVAHGQEGDDHFDIDDSSSGFHELHGGQGNDLFDLYAQNAQINGDAGDDLINLYEGNNVQVNAGADNDIINVYADAQNSIISGDAGDDLFVIRSTDNSSTIEDFEINNPNEKIDLQSLEISYSDLQITQSGADAIISYTSFSGNVILKDTDATLLTQDNFIFKNNGTDNYFNLITASDDDDIINTSGLENYISGQAGDDQFIINKTAKSQTTITDFEVDNYNEKIDLSQFDVNSVDDLYIYNKGTDAYVSLGNEQLLVLQNITKEELSDDNFIFNTNSNNAPTATITTAVTNEDNAAVIDVLAGANDIDGDSLIISSISSATNGVVEIITDLETGYQTIRYTPNDDYNGSDTFTYTIDDGNGGTVTETLTLTVNSINDLPVITLNPSVKTIDEDQSLTITLESANDVEDGTIAPTSSNITLYNITDGANVTVNNNGTLNYIPANNFFGTSTFSYTLKDSADQESSQKIVTIEVASVNDMPELVSIISDQVTMRDDLFNFTIPEDAFTDIDGDVLAYSATLSDGSDLPDWLSFDSSSQSFVGNPPSTILMDTTLSLMVTASDGLLQASQVFDLTIIASNVIEGTDGKDNIKGGDGNDIIYAGDGKDKIKGGDGDDILYGQEDKDDLKGDKGDDTLYGGTGNDKMKGGDGDDILYGQEDKDDLKGDKGDDTLHGGAGDDKINGGDGNDFIDGGLGKDKLKGGKGEDVFNFSSLTDSTTQDMDKIEDFKQGEDVIDLSTTQLTFDDLEFNLDDHGKKGSKKHDTITINDSGSDFAFEIKGDFDELSDTDFIFS